jgi:PIN domain nuclease of toxin-antitoxin system
VTLLLDTHIVLWWWLDKPRLKQEARQVIAASDVVWVSAASAWEVAIKEAIGKLRLPEAFSTMVTGGHFSELPIAFLHTERLKSLPSHHRDPFDRMLVAQAQVEGATLVTHDRRFQPYDVPIVWV